MSTGAIIAIAVIVVVLLAWSSSPRPACAGTAPRRSACCRVRRASATAARTPSRRWPPEEAAPATGREVERAASARAAGRAGPSPSRRRRAPPATVGRSTSRPTAQTRRQFLNRGVVGLMVVGLVAASAPPSSPSCGRRLDGGFGSMITVGNGHRRQQGHRHQAALLQPSGPVLHQPVPDGPDHPGQGQEGLQPGLLIRHEAGLRRAVPEVRPPRLPGAVVPELAVVRVPLPRLAVQPGRREEGRPGRRVAWTASPSPSPRRRDGGQHQDRLRRSADRHQHHRPGPRDRTARDGSRVPGPGWHCRPPEAGCGGHADRPVVADHPDLRTPPMIGAVSTPRSSG